MLKKSCFRGPFEKQHGKRVQTLLKSERQTFSIFIDKCEDNGLTKILC